MPGPEAGAGAVGCCPRPGRSSRNPRGCPKIGPRRPQAQPADAPPPVSPEDAPAPALPCPARPRPALPAPAVPGPPPPAPGPRAPSPPPDLRARDPFPPAPAGEGRRRRGTHRLALARPRAAPALAPPVGPRAEPQLPERRQKPAEPGRQPRRRPSAPPRGRGARSREAGGHAQPEPALVPAPRAEGPPRDAAGLPAGLPLHVGPPSLPPSTPTPPQFR
ncbi:vegetative cell wall protein gp1-like [Canis lupus familiaris]|uniref:vegetative cell wall protein gp1-like n=1 Tax=Canis lupus familiaris TaxID=9615 RepID=UPI0018F32E11|nr:vegetative cell wall protein gp1-like [Canis lupus familiaris]